MTPKNLQDVLIEKKASKNKKNLCIQHIMSDMPKKKKS